VVGAEPAVLGVTNALAAKKSASKKAAKKTAAKKTAAKKARSYSPAASESVREAVAEMNEGELRSGGSGKKVTNRKQAIAIGLSEARRGGAKVPKPKDG
jgi:hypothetical protein